MSTLLQRIDYYLQSKLLPVTADTVTAVNYRELLVPAANVAWLEGKIAELNKKAAKLKVSPITLTKIREEFKPIRVGKDITKVLYYLMRVEGKAPKLNDWTLLAVIDHTLGTPIINVVPDTSLPPVPLKYREAAPECSYCHTKRDRRQTYVVFNSTKPKSAQIQCIGSSCLKDFLGHTDPALFLGYATALNQLDKAISDLEDEERGPREPMACPLNVLLAHALVVIKKYGWVSKAASSDSMPSTSSNVMENIFRKPDQHFKPLPVSEADFEKAKEIIEESEKLISAKPMHKRSDYEHNLLGIIGAYRNNRPIETKFFGYAASIIPYYDKAMAKRKESDSKPESGQNWVGELGQKITVKAKLLALPKPIESQFGICYLVKFEEVGTGNQITWWASNPPTDIRAGAAGQIFTLTGGVKKHDTFNGSRITVVTRVRLAPA